MDLLDELTWLICCVDIGAMPNLLIEVEQGQASFLGFETHNLILVLNAWVEGPHHQRPKIRYLISKYMVS